MGERNSRFNFDAQNRIEEQFTPLVIHFLGEFYDKTVDNVRCQCLEYDFKVGNVTFDLKADTKMMKTGNVFIETESVKGKKIGWLYNKLCHWILYLCTNSKNLYMLNLEQLRQHEKEIMQFPYKEIEQEKDYLTCGHIVPLDIIRKWLHCQPINLAHLP